MNRKIVAALLGASLLAGGGAYAAQQGQPTSAPRGPMLHADANKDGVVTREEVVADADARFAKGDTNKDGQISAEERRAARPHRGPGDPGQQLGTTGQGDREARRAKMLARFDTDKDGTLSDAERTAAREARKGMRGGHHARGLGHGARIDTNGDKLISRDESRTAALAMFDRADANKDGRIDAAERAATRAKMKAMRGQHRGAHDMPPAPAAPAPSSGN